MALTKEQFKKAREKYSVEQIVEFEKRRNSETQESDPLLPGEIKTRDKIKGRQDPVDRLREEVMQPWEWGKHPVKSALRPFITGLKTLGVPYERLSAAVGGAGVGAQKGEGLKGVTKRAVEGLSGETQYRSFDPMRNIGVSEYITTPTEIFTEIAIPMKLMFAADKMLRPITKATDKALMVASNKLLQGADDAVRILGDKLNLVYQPINKVAVNATNVLDDVVKLPQGIIAKMEQEFGKLSTYFDDFNIEKARQFKKFLGKIKPNAFGKSEKGAEELLVDEDINRAYASIKKAMQEGLKNAGKNKESKLLMEADEAFTDGYKAARFVRKTITDSTLQKPTKTGSMALKLSKEGDMSGRVALNILKDAGLNANKSITKAVKLLEKYNRKLFLIKTGRGLSRGAIIGGAAGMASGKIREAIE